MDTSDLIRLLTLQDANTRIVLIGAALLGVACGVVGAFAMLRRRALVGDAVAHAALPGVCVAFLIVGDRDFGLFMLGALVAGIVAAAFIALVRICTPIKEDAVTALAIGSFFGLGLVLSRWIQDLPAGNRAGIDGFILGKAAAMVRADAVWIACAASVVLSVVLVLYKEFKVLCFDRELGAFMGFRTLPLDLALMALICICVVVGLPAVGVVLIVALLVIPPAAARLWTDRLGVLLTLAGGIGLVSGVVGVALSATLPSPMGALTRGWPTGPLIVLVAAGIFLVSLVASPRRGLLGRALSGRPGSRGSVRDRAEERDSADRSEGGVGEIGGVEGAA